METKDYRSLSNEELLAEKNKRKKTKVYFALGIGFLVGILLFGLVGMALSIQKSFGFILPMTFLIIFINRLINNKDHKELEQVLKERNL